MVRQIAIGLCLLTLWPSLAAAQQVIDGNTLRLAGLKYQLCGINVPAPDQPGGPEATAYLRHLIAGKSIRCTPVGQGTPCDGHSKVKNEDRVVAQCFVGKVDLAAEMVRSGHAKDWPKFSGGYYSKGPKK